MTQADTRPGEGAPLFSIVMPTYETKPYLLREAIESVRAQSFADWELLVVDDGSRGRRTRREIERQAGRDKRVRADFLPQNMGISAASNRGVELAAGEWVAFLDHDDTLAPRALERVAAEIAASPSIDVLYTDQETVSADGRRRLSEFRKPDWSPVYALGAMYVGHLLVARRALIEAVGGFDPAFDTIQDFELMLRLSEHSDRIRHIPETLYRWRAIPGSIAAGALEKEGVPELQTRAVNAHLRRRGIPVEALSHPSIPHRNRLAPTAAPEAKVDIVALEPGRQPAARANARANAGDGDYLLFHGEGVRCKNAEWIERLLTCARILGVGAVGPLLLRPDGRLDAAGFGSGRHGDPVAPLLRGDDPDGDGYYGSLACAREVYALSGAALLVERDAFERVGGFEEEYASTHYDFDLCRKLGRVGRSVVCDPAARAIDHTFTAARRRAADPIDRALFVDRWFDELAGGDPYSRQPAR